MPISHLVKRNNNRLPSFYYLFITLFVGVSFPRKPLYLTLVSFNGTNKIKGISLNSCINHLFS